jgi:hypothetical protein
MKTAFVKGARMAPDRFRGAGLDVPPSYKWLLAAEVERLVDDLGGGQIAPEAHLPGRAERAGQRATRLARQAERPAAVAVTHQHGLHGEAVMRLEQRLLGAVAGERLAQRAQGRVGHVARERVAQPAGQVRHLLVGARAAGGPLPHLAGAEARFAARAQVLVQEQEVHGRKFGRRGSCVAVGPFTGCTLQDAPRDSVSVSGEALPDAVLDPAVKAGRPRR